MGLKVFLNPPPADRKCQGCGIGISELVSFGKAGDPLVGDFDGQKLVKTFRGMAEEGSCPELDKILIEQDRLVALNGGVWCGEIETTLEQTFGKKMVDNAYSYDQLCCTVGASWECRDCIIK